MTAEQHARHLIHDALTDLDLLDGLDAFDIPSILEPLHHRGERRLAQLRNENLT